MNTRRWGSTSGPIRVLPFRCCCAPTSPASAMGPLVRKVARRTFLPLAFPIGALPAQKVNTPFWTRLHFRVVGPDGNRASAAVGEPGNPLVAYIGAASGGIWKTEDGGVHWRAMFDSEPAQAIGALAMAPSPHNVLWAGTGETFFIRSMTAPRHGVYRPTHA